MSMNLIIPERFRARRCQSRLGGDDDDFSITVMGAASCWPCRRSHKDGKRISIEFSIQLVKDAAG